MRAAGGLALPVGLGSGSGSASPPREGVVEDPVHRQDLDLLRHRLLPIVTDRLGAAAAVPRFAVPQQDRRDVHPEKLALQDCRPGEHAVAVVVGRAVVGVALLVEDAHARGAVEDARKPLYQVVPGNEANAVLDERLDVERQEDVHLPAAVEHRFREQHVTAAGE